MLTAGDNRKSYRRAMRSRTNTSQSPVIDRSKTARRHARQVLILAFVMAAFVVAAFASVGLFIAHSAPGTVSHIVAASSESARVNSLSPFDANADTDS